MKLNLINRLWIIFDAILFRNKRRLVKGRNACRSTSLLMCIVFCLTTFYGQAYAQDKSARIDELMQFHQRENQFNGSVLVADNGKVIYKKAFGLANMEWNVPNEVDTKFRIASMTKPFTALLVLQLVERGKLKLDGKLSEYLPEYRKDIGDKVTIHHLLNHTSGIPDYTANPKFATEIAPIHSSVDSFIKRYLNLLELKFEPGKDGDYSSSGYYLLGAIIEKTTGKPYAKVLKEMILDPVGMKNTGYDDQSTLLAKRASGYIKDSTGYKNAPYFDMSAGFAAGAMYSTVEDLYLWDQALYTDKLLSDKYKEMMFKPGRSNSYGWSVEQLPVGNGKEDNEERVPVVLHGGSIPGFNGVIVRMFDGKRLIVLLDNAPSRRQNGIVRGIMSILYNKPYQSPVK